MSLKYGILGLLKYEPMTGYELKKVFDKSVANIWYASLSQIYRELGSLEKGGHVGSVIQRQDDRPDKRIYSITEKGEAAFKTWIESYPHRLSKQTRDEFLLRIFFGSNLSGEELIRQFRRYRDEKLGNLGEVKALENTAERIAAGLKLEKKEEFYWKLVLRKASMNLEASIAWAEECITELDEL